MAKNFPKLMTDSRPPTQEAQRTLNMTNTKSTPGPIISKLQETRNKEKILKGAKEKKTPYLYRKKARNYIGLPFTNHISIESRKKCLVLKEKKSLT